MAISIIKIGSTDELRSMRLERNMVALLGSGISIWHPSNLPNGQKIIDDLASVMASGGAVGEVAQKLVSGSAFEHVMERYPNPEVLQSIIAQAFYPTIPNAVHKAFARLLNDGLISHIVTTNYDQGLENACSQVCDPRRMPTVVVEERDAKRIRDWHPVIFKIHGCASPGKQRTLVVSLREEGEMPEWKRDCLERLIHGRTLLVCGYSGLDFEICPELVRLSPKKIVWNSLWDPNTDSDALKPNAKRVLAEKDGTVLVGDMREMLGHLDRAPCVAHFSSVSADFVQQLVDELDEWELDKWRVLVLNGVGCAAAAKSVALRLNSQPGLSVEQQLDALLALAEALFHSGLYMQSSKAYLKAASHAVSSPIWEKRVRAEVGAVDALRVAGYWWAARKRSREISEILPRLAPAEEYDKTQSEIALKRALLRRYPFHIARLVRLNFLARKIQERVKRDLAVVARYSSEKGSWFNLQHCRMLAENFRFDFGDIYSGPLVPLTPYEGYRQLGYVLAEMMAYRGLLSEKTITPPVPRLNYLELAEKAGVHPEVWKLALAIKKRFGKKALTNEDKKLAKHAWRTCEYTFSMRLALLLRGERNS